MAGSAFPCGTWVNHVFDAALGLKHVARAGWLRVGIHDPESVAGHSWGMAWLVMNLCPDNVDLTRALKIAIVHDLPEVLAGDITPHDGISKDEKITIETQAAETLFSDKPEMMDIWKEYAAGESPEARFVKECDALDMALQALHYQRKHGTDPSEFIASAKAKIHSPHLVDFLNEHS